jgi:hypothetical protein
LTLDHPSSALFLEYCYIVDALVFLATRHDARAGASQRLAAKLACLHFPFVLRHRALQRRCSDPHAPNGSGGGGSGGGGAVWVAWVAQLGHFLSFMPVRAPGTEVLYDLLRALTKKRAFGAY